MDTRKLTEILAATIDPEQRQPAEEQLSQVSDFISSIHMLENLTMLPNGKVISDIQDYVLLVRLHNLAAY